MAHPCDHKSRTDKPLDMKALVFKQVVRVMAEHSRDWTTIGLKEYCMNSYKPMGLTEQEYDRILVWFRKH